MKIRSGFVSNSSSSSFVAVMKKETCDNFLSKFEKPVRQALKTLISNQNFMGSRVSVFSYVSNDNWHSLDDVDIYSLLGENCDDDSSYNHLKEKIYDACSELESMAEKLPKNDAVVKSEYN